MFLFITLMMISAQTIPLFPLIFCVYGEVLINVKNSCIDEEEK